MGSKRLDIYLHESGYFESREKARAAVMAGEIILDGRVATKPGLQVKGNEEIRVLREERHVSRGYLKLAHALDTFDIDVRGITAIDVGCSTGGFTQCLIDRGAKEVIAVDVGKGVLHWKLRRDPRVTVLEEVNARYLKKEQLPFAPGFATVDVSFISLKKVLIPVRGVLVEPGELVVLVKPQFEAGREKVQKGGLVKDPAVHREVLLELRRWFVEVSVMPVNVIPSPVKSPRGNIEFLFHLKIGSFDPIDESKIERALEDAHRCLGLDSFSETG